MASLQETIWENISHRPLKISLQGKYYKLTEWPNFGFSKYSPDFIVLSANLTKKFLNMEELKALVQSDEYIINHFLNAASLLQIIEVKDDMGTQKPCKQSVVSKFTDRLKKMFQY